VNAMLASNGGGRLIAPKEAASEWLLGTAEMDVGSWSGLDESGPDKLGVGLFFQNNPSDGLDSFYVFAREHAARYWTNSRMKCACLPPSRRRESHLHCVHPSLEDAKIA